MKKPTPQQVRDQSIELVKSTGKHFAESTKPAKPAPEMPTQGAPGVNEEDVKKQDEQKTRDLEGELAQIRAQEKQKYEDWKKGQEEQMATQEAVMPQGKPSKAPTGPAGGQLKHKQAKVEMGRQAKN